MQSKTIFITGTDTGVGKTLLTACLLEYLLQRGVDALAMKPFCSGDSGDVRLLQAIQKSRLPDNEMNPYFFPEPVAPLVAARKARRRIELNDVVQRIEAVERRCGCLLIEGSGGLMVPLGERFCVADLIARLKCEVVVVARNKLGTLNHTLLTVSVLSKMCAPSQKKRIKVVLMDAAKPDVSARTNREILAETLAPIEVVRFPFLTGQTDSPEGIKNNLKKVKKVLAQIFG